MPIGQGAERWHQKVTQVRNELLQRQRFEPILFQKTLPLHLLLRIGGKGLRQAEGHIRRDVGASA